MRARLPSDGRLIDDTGQDPARADEVAPPAVHHRELRQLVPRVLAALCVGLVGPVSEVLGHVVNLNRQITP